MNRRERRGAALVPALIVVFVLAGMSGALLSFESASQREASSARDSARALYLAEAGVNDAIAQFAASVDNPTLNPPTGSIGTDALPVELKTGSYWVDIQTQGEAVVLTSFGVAGIERRAVEVVLTAPTGGIYANALFAGNSSGDPAYSLDLSGNGAQGDEIDGDIFSAGDLSVSGDASVSGTARAGGTITGIDGEEGITQPLPDIASMDYPNTADIDVAALFAGGDSYYASDDAGGDAWQLPEENPAHIFRMNASDRQTDHQSTAKNDYFLEDPYEPVNSDSDSSGEDAYPITLSGQDGNPGIDGSGLVYYIDGNLWIHNRKTFSFKFLAGDDEDVKVTFVVKGNIYFSDNIFLEDNDLDGVAFIAMKDENYPDESGDIYFGDPSFGTLEYMAAFMYAENNFYDNNLDAAGSAEVTVKGNMTAGNHVAITRDYGDQHSKLTVLHDERIVAGQLDLPGLPGSTGAEDQPYLVVSWREAAVEPQP